MKQELELLAPAGSMDALKAALANGADAVYLGAAAFGARAGAGFDEDSLRGALRLAHLHRKRVYVTVNVLVKDGELPGIRNTLAMLEALGADAVIVQDLGVLKLCREEFPGLPVHASTQMALHNASGVRLLKTLGAKRAVLARECGLDDIREASREGLELEVFCHGALCVSVSGQCLFSSMIGGRSGNRGRCAQPCRLPYAYQGRTGAFLSPRDLCARDMLEQMAHAGAYSFKIEGRLKRPEYVAVVTRAYRKALDAVEAGSFKPAAPEEKESLTQIFSRGGFTGGYVGGQEDAAVIYEKRVTPEGIALGSVQKTYHRGGTLLCDVPLLKDLHNGDGLEIGAQELRYSGPEVPAGSIAALRLRDAVKPGEAVRRTEDESQLSTARKTYENGSLDAALAIPFDAMLTAFPNAPVSLTVTDGESAVTVTGESCAEAQTSALTDESARRLLSKTGGTPFKLRGMHLKTQNAYLPAAALNALRREALDKLTEARIAAHPKTSGEKQVFAPQKRAPFSPRLIVRTACLDDAERLFSSGAELLLYAPSDMTEAVLTKAFACFPENAVFCLPVQCGEDTLKTLRRLTRQYAVPVCVGSPGQIGLFPDAVMAGEGVPIMNSEAVHLLSSLGMPAVTLSREMSRSQLDTLPMDEGELILPVYGRTRLMVLNHCPMRTVKGLSSGKTRCTLCGQGKGTSGTALKDRMGAEYPLLPCSLPEGCIVELMADKPLHLSAYLERVPRVSYLLTFSTETVEDRQAVTAHYAALLRGQSPAPLDVNGTPGRFLTGVM